MGLFGIFKHIAERKKSQISASVGNQDLKRIDANLPLGIKIHCMIKLDETKFIINGDSLKMQSPGGGTHTVAAAEKFMLGDLKIYRIYLESNESEKHSVLHISVEGDKVSDLTLYSLYDEVYPASEDEWDQWLNEENGLIGYRDFEITGEDGNATYYDRLWGGDDDYSEPFTFESTVAFDPYGTEGMKTRNCAMIYGRDVADGLQELLFVTEEEVLDDNGEAGDVRIALYLGIPMNQAEIEVLA